MKELIKSALLECAAETNVFSILFGSESIKEKKTLDINWCFTKAELENDPKFVAKLLLDHTLHEVMSSYDAINLGEIQYKTNLEATGSHVIMEVEEDPHEADSFYHNHYVTKNYTVFQSTKLADLENYLSKIDVSDDGVNVYFKMKFPIYEVDEGEIKSFTLAK